MVGRTSRSAAGVPAGGPARRPAADPEVRRTPLAELSSEQRAAVERIGQDVCVVAGPGSGKTRVLTERFAWLLETQYVEPARILAITFTEKAATEIKQRLILRFSDNPEQREALERVWVSTIDGFCARLLREHSIAAGLAPDFTVLEAGASKHMLRLAAEDALDALYREQPSLVRRLLDALDLSTQDDLRQPDLADSLIQVYEAMRISGVDELPAAAAEPALFEEAQGLASLILRDATPGSTPNMKANILRLNEWARAFRALPASPIQEAHLALAAWPAGVNTGHIGRTSRYDAARRLKNELLPELQAALLGPWYEDLHDLLRTAVRRIASAYAAAKRAESAVDFGDLEEFAIRLLESDESIRAHVQQRFDFMLMDELQDTNPLQWRLVKLVKELYLGAFFGVGDPNQSIYGFRHADPELFETYRAQVADFGGAIDTLSDNYRSRPEILAAVERTLQGVAGIEARTLTAKRAFEVQRELVVERLLGQGENGGTAANAEAEQVASRIRQMVDSEGRNFDHIAVLLRSLTSLDPFARAFDRFDIPFLVSGGRTFLEARETRDLMGLVAALANPLDEIATVGVLRGPLCGISDEEIFRMGREGRQQAFEERFGSARRMAGFLPPDLLLARALDACSYTESLSKRAAANVDKFLGWVRREHRRRPRPLPELLETLEALRETQSEAEAPPPEASDAVRVMTIHNAKGLEFPVVFLAALHRKPDASQPPILFSSELGLGAKWRNPVSGKGQSDSVHKALVAERKTREEAEENRLIYVAMTRAEDQLILSYVERKRPMPYDWIPLATGATQTPPIPSPAAIPSPPPAPRSPYVQRLAPMPGQYDSSASVTAVAEFAACPRKYYLGHYLGLDPITGPGTGAIQMGLDVHRALAGARVDSLEANDLAERFRASDLGIRAARASRIEREFDFMLPIEDVILSGQIDLWFEEGGELVLVDYKTDRQDEPNAYTIQLQIYALALERYAGRLPDRAVLYYLRQDKPVEVPLSEAELEAARATVRKMRDAQESLTFPLNPGTQCARCRFYQGACPVATFP